MKLLQERHECAVNETSAQAVDLLVLTGDALDVEAEPEAPSGRQDAETLDAGPSQAGSSPMKPNLSREQIRRQKVLAIRHQFQLGQYEVEARLAAILDKLLEDLTI